AARAIWAARIKVADRKQAFRNNFRQSIRGAIRQSPNIQDGYARINFLLLLLLLIRPCSHHAGWRFLLEVTGRSTPVMRPRTGREWTSKPDVIRRKYIKKEAEEIAEVAALAEAFS
ncbi:unnamed protein product, partial [Prorocentrum cordatum]